MVFEQDDSSPTPVYTRVGMVFEKDDIGPTPVYTRVQNQRNYKVTRSY